MKNIINDGSMYFYNPPPHFIQNYNWTWKKTIKQGVKLKIFLNGKIFKIVWTKAFKKNFQPCYIP